MTDVVVEASFYDAKCDFLNMFQWSADLQTINPGGISPFKILYTDTETVTAVTSYKLSAMGSVKQLKPGELQVHSDNSRLDILGFH